jgi:hypothetical protein
MMREEYPETDLSVRVEQLEEAHRRINDSVVDLFTKLLGAEDQCRNLTERVAANENDQTAERFVNKTALGLLMAHLGKPGLNEVFQSYIDGTGPMVKDVSMFKAASKLADDIVEEARDWCMPDIPKAA